MQSSLGQQNIQQPIAQTQQVYAQPQQQVQSQAQQCPVQCQQAQVPQASQYQTSPIGQAQQGQNVQVPNYSGVNIQIFNPSVTPPGATAPVYNVNAPNYSQNPGCYPPNYYTNNYNANGANGSNGADANGVNGANSQNNANSTINTTENKTTDKKTEKREIVQLTDDYIKNLENYLNSQDKEVRMMGAKEVLARLEEDHSRKDDKALNALINKMLQDPSTPIRVMALSALDSRVVTGDNFTINILKQLQNSKDGYGQDALQATDVLLKMSGQKVEKEFEVKDSDKKKTESKKSEKTEKTGEK